MTFDLSPRDLSFVDAAGARSVAPGRYRLSVGAGQPDGDAAVLSVTYRVHARVGLPE